MFSNRDEVEDLPLYEAVKAADALAQFLERRQHPDADGHGQGEPDRTASILTFRVRFDPAEDIPTLFISTANDTNLHLHREAN